MSAIKQLGKNILVLNAGSSSLKFKVYSADGLKPFMGGMFDRIGDLAKCTLIAKGTASTGETKKWEVPIPAKDHVAAMENIMAFLKENVSSTFDKEVAAVGHRIVHGLDVSQPVLLCDTVVDKIKAAATLAPLHNPPGLQGIEASKAVFKGVPNVGVFDTAFHQTMPPHAYMYALPYELYEKHSIRRYGFHGTSHKYLVEQAAEMLNKPIDQVNVITCHLGSGSSMAAVKGGKSVDTTMGLTPLEGLIMGTRSGDLDPALVLFLQNQLKLSTKDTDTLLNKKSGLLGVAGAADLRSVIEMNEKGDARGALALSMWVYRIRKYIGAYTAALQGNVDAVIFSAGIGENSSYLRNMLLDGMNGMGLNLDKSKNEATVGGKAGDIAVDGSKVKLLVIPTDEELSIAKQTLQVVSK